MSPLRVGVAGTGYWAQQVHAPGAAAHPGTELVAVWGRQPDRAVELADQHGARAEPDWDTFLDQVDAVVFAVPPDAQADLALRAAKAGRHLLLEKPTALDPAMASAIADEIENAGASSVVFFTERFNGAREEWLQDMASRDCHGGRATWLASLLGPDNPYAASPWRREHGALWDVGPHALSVLLPVLGPVTDVHAAPGPGDETHAVLRHEGGAASVMALSLTMPPAATRFDCAFATQDGWYERPEERDDVATAYARALSELLEDAAAGSPGHRCGARFGAEVVTVLDRVGQTRDGVA